MLLTTHIVIALFSIILGTDLLIHPRYNRVRIQIALIVTTLFSGTLLLITQPGIHLVSFCISGIAYLAFTSLTVAIATRKLAKEKKRID